MPAPNAGGTHDSHPSLRCDYCQSWIPTQPITVTYEQIQYQFCTTSCRDALESHDHVFTKYRGHRFVPTGIDPLDSTMPPGLLRNSTVLVQADTGTRNPEMLAELGWRALLRGEPVVFVTFKEPPIALIERFFALDWNVLPFLESGDFHILDCISYRVEDRERMVARMNRWNAYLHSVAHPEVTAVRNPADISELESQLDRAINRLKMVDEGLVVIDSLTELGSMVQPVRAYNFVKDILADISKGRFVTVYAGGDRGGPANQFPHDLEYLFDGIFDLEHNPDLVDDVLVKRFRVRKMSGVHADSRWIPYEILAGRGFVVQDPQSSAQTA